VNIPASKRLSYQLMTPADAGLLFQLDQDEDVMRYINGGIKTSKEDIERIFVPRMQSYTNEQEGWGLWQVKVAENQEFIGWILIRPMAFFCKTPELNNLEIGWRFHRSSWGKGYATEAAKQVMMTLIEQDVCNESKLKKFTAIAKQDNKASINIMKKLGMKYTKTEFNDDPLINDEVVFYQFTLSR